MLTLSVDLTDIIRRYLIYCPGFQHGHAGRQPAGSPLISYVQYFRGRGLVSMSKHGYWPHRLRIEVLLLHKYRRLRAALLTYSYTCRNGKSWESSADDQKCWCNGARLQPPIDSSATAHVVGYPYVLLNFRYTGQEVFLSNVYQVRLSSICLQDEV